MKKKLSFVLFFLPLVIKTSLLLADTNHFIAFHDELFNELKLMSKKDQEIRSKVINLESSDEEMIKIDRAHLSRLKEIIHQFGWPGFQLVGEEGAEHIWLLIQHCDEDLDFQRTCLALLEEAVLKNDASKMHLAYLKDRVLVNEGKEQIYGTQMQIIEGKIEILPIKDPNDLDKRREEMGLCSFDEYLSLIKEVNNLKE